MSKNQKEILCTLGPASMNNRVIRRLTDIGVSLFRINLSHTRIELLEEQIKLIQSCSNVPVCLDSEGAQIRSSELVNGAVDVNEHDMIEITGELIIGDEKRFCLNPVSAWSLLKVGDMLSIDFNTVLVQIIEEKTNSVMARVISGGRLGQNKAITVDRSVEMAPLSSKDYLAMEIGQKMGIRHVALSFANKASDIIEMRSMVSSDTFLISKIESRLGIENLDEIASASNAILLDRGDMSREVMIEQIPRVQKQVIQSGNRLGAKVYVATNLLETMISGPNPTRAEVNDIFNTLNDGADGLVLAAETAIGQYPIKSAIMVRKVIDQYERYTQSKILTQDEMIQPGGSLLVEPHGGALIHQESNISTEELNSLKPLDISYQTLLDLEQIAIGTYSPLKGFMNQEEVESVINQYRLLEGDVWTLPILCPLSSTDPKQYSKGDVIALRFKEDGQIYGTLKVESVFQLNLKSVTQGVFTTSSKKHPGVVQYFSQGEWFVSGEIQLSQRYQSANKYHELTPRQVRTIFEHKGWSRVVAFHTRNVAHRAHEYLQLTAYQKQHCDGLFIHPLIGPKKPGDYSAEIIMKSYEVITRKYYPKERVLSSAFSNYPRYAGPREAVFTALCRKNFGCSHFIVGRDHSGVGNYYLPEASKNLFSELGPIGIKSVAFNEIVYCEQEQKYIETQTSHQKPYQSISGTQARDMIANNECPPEWFMRKEVSDLILNEINSGREVFQS